LQKLLKMPRRQAWVESSKVLSKEEAEHKDLKRGCRIAQSKVENVSWEGISVIDLSHYMILQQHCFITLAQAPVD
jgi:hypothetical protein